MNLKDTMMTTLVKNRPAASGKTGTGRSTKTTDQKTAKDEPTGMYEQVAVSAIDFSPLNYRKYYDPGALKELATQLSVYGIISPLTLRKLSTGRYELVAGERRLRAAQMAGLAFVPAMIRTLTDYQVMEIQLAENIQRENPHPLHEAQAITQLQQAGKSMEEIARRLGKSKSYVHSRLKLVGLITVMQDIFLAGKLSVQQANEIAALSSGTQNEFYEDCCSNWQEENFRFNNLSYALNRYRCDLARAPFNTKDNNLVPEAGACTRCPFNSATLSSLFPEYAQAAVCNNKGCFQSKCRKHIENGLRDALQHQPAALVHRYGPSSQEQEMIASVPELSSLPQFYLHDVRVVSQPKRPVKEDFFFRENDQEQQVFDQTDYNLALAEYEQDVEEHERLLSEGKILKGLLLSESKVKILFFNPDGSRKANPAVTAKQAQEAIKAGAATPELLQEEINRIHSREERAKELDKEKIQLQVHQSFSEHFSVRENSRDMTGADWTAVRLIVYQSLDHSVRKLINDVLFPDKYNTSFSDFYAKLEGMPEDAFAFMVRISVSANPNSKIPGNETGWCQYELARNTGIDVNAIEQRQQQKATLRNQKVQERVADIEKRKTQLSSQT